MHTLTWNHHDIQQQFPQCKTLATLVQEIEMEVKRLGNVVCEWKMNGHVLEEDDISKLATTHSKEIQNLSIKAGKPEALLVESIQSAKDLLFKMITVAQATAQEYRIGNFDKAQNMMDSILGSSDWVLNVLVYTQGFLSNTVDQAVWQKAESANSEVLAKMIMALQKKDFVLIADILQYDFVEVISLWQDYLNLADKEARILFEHARKSYLKYSTPNISGNA